MSIQVGIFLGVVLAIGGLLIWASIKNNAEMKQQKNKEKDLEKAFS
ncbi:MAG: hypothetical protein IE914_04285 [Thiotrichales bacterium]|nr:hypothetical protein [Thiotrichales bacterium]